MDENAVMYTAVYDGGKNDALADLGTLDQLHRDDLVGKYDAAVIDQEDGKPRIVKRADRPGIDVDPRDARWWRLEAERAEGGRAGARSWAGSSDCGRGPDHREGIRQGSD